jgi:PIN domain
MPFRAVENRYGQGWMVFSFRAGGAFFRPKGIKALDSEPAHKAAMSAEIYRRNAMGEMPDLTDLKQSAIPPRYEDRIGSLLLAITSLEEREGHGCEMGERNPAADEPGEDTVHFRAELLAATGSAANWELQQIIDDAGERQLLRVSADPHSDCIYGRLFADGFEAVRRIKSRLELLPRQSKIPPEDRVSVTIAPDTNFFVEFSSVKAVEWPQLLPKTQEIRLIILPKVGDEIDALKRRSGRVRKRAVEFGALAREMETAPDERIVVRETVPRVTMEFAPIFRREELDQNLFELEDNDGRIVSEAYRLAEAIPELVFLSDDSKPLRLARKAGLDVIRPPESWRRKEAD